MKPQLVFGFDLSEIRDMLETTVTVGIEVRSIELDQAVQISAL